MKMKITIDFILSCCMFILPSFLPAQQWQTAASLNVPRTGACAVNYNQQLYIFGGKTTGNTVLNSVEKYDPVSGIWDISSVASFQYARYNASAVVFNDKIYLTGGRNNSEVLDQVEVYDPVQNQWFDVHNLRKRRESHTAVVFNDTLTVIGGMEDQYHYLDKIEWYDSTEDIWEERDSTIFQERAAAFISVYYDYLYVCGGTYYGLTANGFLADTHFSWSPGPQMQTGRSYGGMVEVEHHLYMIGGETSGGVSALVEIYHPDTWSIEPGINLPTPRSGIAAVSINDTIYAIGGWSVNHYQILNTVEYFIPQPNAIDDQNGPEVPESPILVLGYPNPFNGMVNFEIQLADGNQYDFSIFDINGRLVNEIYNGYLPPGAYKFRWNARNQADLAVASGIYIFLAKSNQFSQKLKIIYAK